MIKRSIQKVLFFSATIIILGNVVIFGQTGIPEPGPVRSVNIPPVKETKLNNGLTVAVIEKRNIPIITVQLLVRSGSSSEGADKAGLADMTASMLTKGTKTRTAEQIAEQIEFLGGTISSGAGWNNSAVTVSVTSDKLEQAMAIMSDVVLNPNFPQSELELLRSQALDGLTYNLTQPGFLANYVSSKFSFGEHPSGGTHDSISAIDVKQITDFYNYSFVPNNATLIFAGDISQSTANALAKKLFGQWKAERTRDPNKFTIASASANRPAVSITNRFLIIDMPDSGQASVSYHKNLYGIERQSPSYYSASTLNSLLGGGYSSRLNQEIRIKRGLSYGAGSSFGWRPKKAVFNTRTQTKNESAPEVAELVLSELNRLIEESISESELVPRRSVLTGGFGRNIETTGGLLSALADLYIFNIPANELNNYMPAVNRVTEKQIRDFAKANLTGGDIIIVGDYAKFKEEFAKRFPNVKPNVIPIADLDITQVDLRRKN